uniref:CTCK domain-containing protein n=1 Tax=Clastoptera arizonana TaxID=38151 RepID=A0A1B6C9F2_9HEMI
MGLGRSTAFLLILCYVEINELSAALREHKVHNIVLYPHKHSWCKTTAIKQVVAYPGCDSIEIDNNVCVGACFSYSIPRTLPSAPGEVVPYCDSCQPSQATWQFVTLKCSSGEYAGEEMKKQVEVIENCTCTKCSDQTILRKPDEFEDLDEDEKTSLNSTTLFDLMHSVGGDQGNFTSLLNLTNLVTENHHNHSLINERTLVLLGELSSDKANKAPDQVALQEILSHVEGEDHKVNEDTLADFVRTAEEKGHINVDIKRLRNVLEKLDNAGIKKNTTIQNQHRHQHHMLVGPHHSLVKLK